MSSESVLLVLYFIFQFLVKTITALPDISVNSIPLNFTDAMNTDLDTRHFADAVYYFQDGEIVNCRFFMKNISRLQMTFYNANNDTVVSTTSMKKKNDVVFRARMSTEREYWWLKYNFTLKDENTVNVYRIEFRLAQHYETSITVMVNDMKLAPTWNGTVIKYLYFFNNGENVQLKCQNGNANPVIEDIDTFIKKKYTTYGCNFSDHSVPVVFKSDTRINGPKMSGFNQTKVLYQYTDTKIDKDGASRPVWVTHYQYEVYEWLNLTCVDNTTDDKLVDWISPVKHMTQSEKKIDGIRYTSKIFDLKEIDNGSNITCNLIHKHASGLISSTVLRLHPSPKKSILYAITDVSTTTSKITTPTVPPVKDVSKGRRPGIVPTINRARDKPTTPKQTPFTRPVKVPTTTTTRTLPENKPLITESTSTNTVESTPSTVPGNTATTKPEPSAPSGNGSTSGSGNLVWIIGGAASVIIIFIISYAVCSKYSRSSFRNTFSMQNSYQNVDSSSSLGDPSRCNADGSSNAYDYVSLTGNACIDNLYAKVNKVKGPAVDSNSGVIYMNNMGSIRAENSGVEYQNGRLYANTSASNEYTEPVVRFKTDDRVIYSNDY